MFDLLGYVRNLFSIALIPSKKRRSEEPERPTKKQRRDSSTKMSNNEDDWISTSSSCSIRRPYANGTSSKYMDNSKLNEHKQRLSWSKNCAVITIEDDDDDIKIKEPSLKIHHPIKIKDRVSSFPNCSKNSNSNFHCNYFDRRLEPKKRVPLSNNSFPSNSVAVFNAHKTSNGGNISTETFLNYNTFREDKLLKRAPVRRHTYSAALDQSIRLDEKRKYQEMLNKSIFGSQDSIGEYSTPTGKLHIAEIKSRGKKSVELCLNPKLKTIAYIDLTSRKPRLSTKDTIVRVLNNFDGEVVEVKDNDSDVEILPEPPSPEPDFKIDRINSLKSYVKLSETTQDDWIENLMKNHSATISKHQQQIAEQEDIKSKLSKINTEIRLKKLEDDVKKVLQIKDILLPIEKLAEKLPALTPEQERRVANCFDRRAPESEILISKFNLNIARRDIMTLYGLNWLNDEVINFYMNLIIERAKDPKWPKTHTMNTFFYHKISKDGYNSVRRWTKKVDIFSYDLLIVPVHLSMHWCMAIVDFRSKSIDYYDSMGSNNDKCLKILYNYLQQEHSDKKRTEFNMKGWETRNVKKIPQQMNGSDCGMFACTFAEFLTRDAKITFTQEDMPYLRRKMVVEITEGRLLIS